MKDYDGEEYPDVEDAASFAAAPDRPTSGCGRRTGSRTSSRVPSRTTGNEVCPFCVAPTLSDEEALIVARGTPTPTCC